MCSVVLCLIKLKLVTAGFYLLLSNPICEQHRTHEPGLAEPALDRNGGSDRTRTAWNNQHIGWWLCYAGNQNLIMVILSEQ